MLKRNIKLISLITLFITNFLLCITADAQIAEYPFSYTGDYQEFEAPFTGVYKLEVWGASGADAVDISIGGKGGYAKGYHYLNAGEKLYIYVGGQGQTITTGKSGGGYNGGGNAATGTGARPSGGGGGATDIRTYIVPGGLWSNTTSLESRIIVAGGGGGAADYYTGGRNLSGGAGGGLTGIAGNTVSSNIGGSGGSQTAAGYASGQQSSTIGAFGVGGHGLEDASSAGGGGGGYYGGGGSYCAGGGGGSSYIDGCSSYNGDSPTTIAGNSSMPTHDGTSTMTGNLGDGYAKITLMEIEYNFDFNVEGALIYPEVDAVSDFKYDVLIPEDNFQTKITYNLFDNSFVIGADEVTLQGGTVRNIIVVDKSGYAYVYQLNIIVGTNVIENVEFAEIDFEFSPNKKVYDLSVDSSITQITPTVTTNLDYEIIGNLNLSYGTNKIEIKTNNAETTYTFYITKQLPASIPTFEFSYTGNYQEFTAPYTGTYKFEVWGASGGDGYNTLSVGGKGGYSKGYYNLTEGQTIYIYVGGAGTSGTASTIAGGYNGGGDAQIGSYSKIAGSGGGATDIRTYIVPGGLWSDTTSLQSRIIVAGGGGGAGGYYTSTNYNFSGGAGGGLSGVNGSGTSGNPYGTAGSQTAAGYASGQQASTIGSLGIGGNGLRASSSAGAGGGGYYGGGGSYCSGGGGGSGYIAALSSFEEDEAITLTGNDEIPTHDGTDVMTGNTGNGFAKITAVTYKETLTNLTVDKGEMLPSFDVSTFEYTVLIGSDVEVVNIEATAASDVSIYGDGEVYISSSIKEHTLTTIDADGEISIYTITFERQKSSNQFLDGFNINGENFEGFQTGVFEYEIEMPFDTEYIHIFPIKAEDAQEVTNDGLYIFDQNSLTVTVVSRSENGSESQHYQFNFTREVSTKLKDIVFDNQLIDYDFDPLVNNYVIEIPEGVFSVGVEGIPYYNGVNVNVTGNTYIDVELNTVTVTSTLEGVESTIYTFKFNKVKVGDVNNDYGYTGSYQTFTAPVSGIYQIELWGASGGNGDGYSFGGKGGYVSGNIKLTYNEKLYIFIGGEGASLSTGKTGDEAKGGYNGGASGYIGNTIVPVGAGGGATDVRLYISPDGNPNNFVSLKSRIMVAGAGGGAASYYRGKYNFSGGAGGGLTGNNGLGASGNIAGTAGSQTSGGYAPGHTTTTSSFGLGGLGKPDDSSGAGGGAGYYGGGGGYAAAGAGGSSYISGHLGSNSISENSTDTNITHTGSEMHYSGKYFTDTIMIDGYGYNWTDKKGSVINMPTPNGDTYATGTGHQGHGAAKITLLNELSSNNYLENIILNDGDIEIDFKPYEQEYNIVLSETDFTLKIEAILKDSTSVVTGTGVINLVPGENHHYINVLGEDGNIRTYVLNITRPISADPYPKEIQVNRMYDYICNQHVSYCNYTYQQEIDTYAITLPVDITEIELKPILKSEYQTVKISKVLASGEYVEETDNIINLVEASETYQVQITSEAGSPTVTYTYTFDRDMESNNRIAAITITNPDIEIPNFSSAIYEYYLNIPDGHDTYDISITTENPLSTVRMLANNGREFTVVDKSATIDSLAYGINDLIIVVTSPNGKTKSYVLHVYKEASSNVFLSNIDVVNKDTQTSLEMTPTFSKFINDYVIDVANDVTTVDIKVTKENTEATVIGGGEQSLKSGMNTFTITVTSLTGDTNIYNITINRAKNSNTNLSNLAIEGYTLEPEFSNDIQNYSVYLDSNVESVNVLVTPEESTTTYTVRGHTYLNATVNEIVVTSIAEDKSYKTFTIKTIKSLSNIDTLDNLTTSEGDFNETFDKELTTYTKTVGSDVNKIEIIATKSDPLSTVEGDGIYSLTTGENYITVNVISQSGNTNTYNIIITKEADTNTELLSVTNNRGSEVSKVDSSTLGYHYLIDVQYEINSIEILGTPVSSLSHVEGNGTFALNVGNNDFKLRVVSEAGTYQDYIVRVVRDESTNDDLEFLYVYNGSLSPTFKKTTVYYEVKVPFAVTRPVIEAIPEDLAQGAYVTILNNDDDLSVGVAKDIIVRVTAPASNTKDYILRVTRQPATEENLALSDLRITSTQGTLDEFVPTFNPDTLDYTLTVANNITQVTINGTPLDTNAQVYGNGTYDLEVGKNVLTIIVTGIDGVQRDYQVIVTRAKSSDATLKTLVVKGHTLSPSFNSNTESYTLKTSSSKLTFTSIIPTESDATYEIKNNQDFVTGLNTVEIVVTAPDGTSTKTYKLNVTKSGSQNNNLATLSVEGYTLLPTFHKGVTFYAVEVDNNINNILIKATAEDETATISGVGLKTVATGENYFDIIVTSEENTTKTYTILVTKEANDNNYLANLTDSEGLLKDTFNKEVNSYEFNVSNEVDSITIGGYAESSTSTVTGLGSHSLAIGENTISVTVTSESGLINIYTIVITREKSISPYLINLSVEGYTLSDEFNKELFEYYLTVPYEVESINVIPVKEDETATVIINENAENDFTVPLTNVGMNEITIKVTDTNDNTVTYTIYVNRTLSTNNYLLGLSVSEGTLSPTFDPTVLTYDVTVPSNITSIDVSAVVEDASSKITSGTGTHELDKGKNVIQVKVKSMIGITRTYTINVTRELSNNTNLLDLNVYVGEDREKYEINYQADTIDYRIDLESYTEKIEIIGILEDANATISGDGVHYLSSGENTINVTITAEDGSTNIYTIVVNNPLDSNNYAISITPSSGSLEPVFTKDNQKYNLYLEANVNTLSFEVELESAKSSVSGIDNASVPEGSTTREIVITAEDGSKFTYTITVIKEVTSEARLASLSIAGYEFEFDSDTFTYNIQVSEGKRTLLASEITAIPKDENATVNLMGDLDLALDMVNVYTIEVIAKDGYTTQTYTLNITRDSETHTISSEIYDIIRDDADEDYGVKIEPKTTLDNFIANFENDPATLKLYDKKGNLVTEQRNVYTGDVLALEIGGVRYDQIRVIVTGDTTGDGVVDVLDSSQLNSHILRRAFLESYSFKAGDLNRDTTIDVLDSSKMTMYILRKFTQMD